jgi:phage tail sheath protein FI
MAYSTPGVYVSESTFKSRVASINLSSSIAAFFGTSDRGPVSPTLISTWTEFTSLFGPVSTSHDLGYAVYHYFANGGPAAYVTRVVGTGATTSEIAVKYYTNGGTGASATLFDVEAIDPGTWGNTIQISITEGLVTPAVDVIPTFNVVVTLDGLEVERWTEVSTEVSNSRYVGSVINTYSRYIRISNIASILAGPDTDFILTAYTLAGGTNDAPDDEDYADALDLLDTIEGVLMINAVGKYTGTVVNAVMAKALDRGTSIAIIDPSPLSTDKSAFIAEVSTHRSSPGSNYAIFCAPMLTMVDPARSGPAAIRRTYPGGAVAGLYARTEAERSVAKTPAGYSADIRNALGIDLKLTEGDIGDMYNAGINCFKQVPGAGIVLFGGRTLERLRPDRYISVRRSLNYLKQALKDATQFAVFEPNDERLWAAVRSACGNVLSTFWAAGGLKGSQNQAYYVTCDSTNNTVSTVDDGEVHVEIGVALQQPAEFIVINISQWTGGSNAVETL